MDINEEIQEKTERLTRLAFDEGLAGVLINSQPNFSWLTAGGTNGVDQSREAGVGTLLVRRDGRRFVLANKIEMARLMQEEINGQGYEPVQFGWEEEKANPALVTELARSLMNDDLPLGSDLPLGGEARPIESAIARARYRLTVSEIDRFKLLGRDAGDDRRMLFRHPVPTDRRWEKVLMIVVCARRSGLIASLTRIVCAGAIPEELRS